MTKASYYIALALGKKRKALFNREEIVEPDICKKSGREKY